MRDFDVRAAMTGEEIPFPHPSVAPVCGILHAQQSVWDMIDLPHGERIMLTLLATGFTPPFDRTYPDGSRGSFDAKSMSWVVTNG